MAMYRKKPIVVEAWRWTPPELADMPDWLSVAIENGTCRCHQDGDAADMVVTIDTLEGVMAAQPGDWIIQGVKGEIYPCKPGIFAMTYDPAETERLPDVEQMPPGARADAMQGSWQNTPYWPTPKPGDPNWRAQPIGPSPPLGWTPPPPIHEDDYNHPNQRATRFRDEIEQVINGHSRENGSDTPDFILAQFVLDVMDAFDRAVTRRSGWYGADGRNIVELRDQLQAEGEHTAAGQAEIERLNTAVRLRDDQITQLRAELQRVSMAGLAPTMVGGTGG